mmetsp:Transcript_32325/g.94560  ORF Transcript_32325/g.94560 Transcript_32325/m.94560 type:complete len:209 (-) Transcript_32325:635-1261(-)
MSDNARLASAKRSRFPPRLGVGESPACEAWSARLIASVKDMAMGPPSSPGRPLEDASPLPPCKIAGAVKFAPARALLAKFTHKASSAFTQSVASCRIPRAAPIIPSSPPPSLSPAPGIAGKVTPPPPAPPGSPRDCSSEIFCRCRPFSTLAIFSALAFVRTASKLWPMVFDKGWSSPSSRLATWCPAWKADAAWSHCWKNSRSTASAW